MTDRKMATVRRIAEILPIPDADAIELAVVDGWKVVVKKNEFVVNDYIVYCEIDSWIPTEIASFLSKGKEPREYNGVKGERLRTIKLRGQISQGLILPYAVIMTNYDGECNSTDWDVGDDVSSILNIQKYEPPIPACLAGVIRGNFPSFIPKTDQERIQNLKKEFESYKDYTWEVTEKLDGSSCTMYYNNGEFGVCSRNLDLKYDENNTFWKMAIAYDVEEKLKNLGKNIAIQGEVIGEGIQGNPYVIKGQKFFVFDVYDIDNAEYLDSRTREEVVAILDLKHVPVFGMLNKIPEDFTIHTLLELAEGKSSLNPNTEREGLVYKCYQDPSISFKCISNLFLIKNGG
jgi:RNA ligase (TIGR02306 family)